jgi:hypothetical protein
MDAHSLSIGHTSHRSGSVGGRQHDSGRIVSITGSSSETGLEEIKGDLLESGLLSRLASCVVQLLDWP